MVKFKQIVITGASRGIGKETALELANETEQMVLAARSTEGLKSVAAEVKKINPRCQVEIGTFDLAQREDVDRLAQEYPDADAVVLNAGVGYAKAFLNQEPKEFNHMIQLNCEGLTTLCWHYGNKMKSRGKGHIVLIASMAGYLPTPYMSVYSATKAYVVHLGECLQMEFHKTGIFVSTICPGGVKTDFPIQAGLSAELLEKYRSTMITPQKVAESVRSALNGCGGVIVPGFSNKSFMALMKFLPRKALVQQVGNVYRKYVGN